MGLLRNKEKLNTVLNPLNFLTGRAGRVDIGKVYRMVPKQFYEQFMEYNTPEIKVFSL